MTSGKNLHENLDVFLKHIDTISDTLPMTLHLISPYNKKAKIDFFKFFNDKVKLIKDENGKKSLLVKADEFEIFETLKRNALTSALASKIIRESLFVSLISHYDAFLTRLLRAIYEIKPDVLNGSERNLTFSQLVKMETIAKAREFIIEKEIDTVLRKSHSEQFDYLEKLIGIRLRENLQIWPTFIEITERRNLFVHCDGYVSNQYINNCDQHNCTKDRINVGDRLGVESEYFSSAYECLYEIATKLTHTIWRKLLDSDLEDADRKLNDVCYHLINTNSFVLADILLKFGCDQRTHFNDSQKNVFIVHRALSKYLQTKKDEANEILQQQDWSASSDTFKLAYAVLTDNFNEAYQIMYKIGNSGEVKKSEYKQWPLFNRIREIEEFKTTYKNIFNEDYTVMETPMRPLQQLINKLTKKKQEIKDKTVKKVDSA